MNNQSFFDSIVVMIIFILIFMGLVLGSFINAWVWRLHEQLDTDGNPKKLSKKKQQAVAISTGRSMCPHCKHELAPKDLVPVFSWLWLRGKCRYCASPISAQYPIVEATTALLFVLSWLLWPSNLSMSWYLLAFITWLVALVGLIALMIYDVRWMLLPNRMIFPLLAIVGASTVVQFILGRPIRDIVSIIFTIAITSGVFWVLYQISAGKWLGGGDVKLGLLTGLLIGYPAGGLMYLFFASILGLFWVVPGLVSKKVTLTQRVPFGPFLIASTVLVVLFGTAIIDWYATSLLGL